jgi:hypothetical protein
LSHASLGTSLFPNPIPTFPSSNFSFFFLTRFARLGNSSS